MRQKNYPLYETTVFRDFRVMTENVANRYPDRKAVSYKRIAHDTEWVHRTYAEVREDQRDLGTALAAAGCRDARVALIGAASYPWMCTYFALMAIGAVTVPIDKELPLEEMASILQSATCAFAFVGEESKEKVAAAVAAAGLPIHCFSLEENGEENSFGGLIARGRSLFEGGDNGYYDYEIDADRMASIVFTSGTTGKGKGVMLSQTNIVSDMTQGMYNFAITPRTMCVLPPHHTFCSTVNLTGHFAQGSQICFSSGLRYLLGELKEMQPTHLVLVPLFVDTFYKRIWAQAEKQNKDKLLRFMMKVSNGLRHIGIDLRHRLFAEVLSAFGGKLEMIICGGAALNQDVINTFDAIGITVLNGYGITECAPLISCNRNRFQKSGSVGTPIIGEQIKIADPDENGEGEICVKGPNVMLGYYNDPEATAAVFDEEGYFRTGDYGRLDEEGWVYITGRLKNLILFSNGKNVYPEEIECELSRIRGVTEAVVYAGQSKSRHELEIIVAEIFPDYELLAADGVPDVQAYFEDEVKKLNARSAPYKKIGKVKIRKEEFVKNTSRKIIRYALDKTIE